jgi:CheY-like chemotaxis protein
MTAPMAREPMVLLADDDDAMLSLLRVSLEKQGYSVAWARDGRELIGRLAQAKGSGRVPDVVVSDARMPGATGIDALRWLRTHLPEVPFILITAFGDAYTHRLARSLGARDVLDKPFDPKQLYALIEDAVRNPHEA